MNLTQFTAHGPFKIPSSRLPSGSKTIRPMHAQAFWAEHGLYANKVGVYVFAIRAGGGVTPMYVGKATKSFAQESYSTDKLNKYFNAMGQYKRGTPVMFFVAYPKKAGAVNAKHIGALEKFRIQQGRIVNSKLLNKVHAKLPTWGISGALRSKTKKPTKQAAGFRDTFALAG